MSRFACTMDRYIPVRDLDHGKRMVTSAVVIAMHILDSCKEARKWTSPSGNTTENPMRSVRMTEHTFPAISQPAMGLLTAMPIIPGNCGGAVMDRPVREQKKRIKAPRPNKDVQRLDVPWWAEGPGLETIELADYDTLAVDTEKADISLSNQPLRIRIPSNRSRSPRRCVSVGAPVTNDIMNLQGSIQANAGGASKGDPVRAAGEDKGGVIRGQIGR